MRMLARWVAAPLLGLILLALATQAVWHRALDHYGGHWRLAPEDAPWVLSDAARSLIKQTFAGVGDAGVVDHGVRVVTRGRLSDDTFVNRSQLAGGATPGPVTWLERQMRAHTAGIAGDPQPDAIYISRLLRQVDAMPGDYRLWLQAEDAAGRPPQPSSPDASDTTGSSIAQGNAPPLRQPVVTNRYVHWLASRAPDSLQPILSIAPGQPDRLARWAGVGITYMRWNPARAMAADDASQPAGAATQTWFKALATRDIRLQITVGRQRAADGSRVWVAPSVAEPALSAGVAVELVLGGPSGDDGEQLMPAVFRLLDKHDHADALTVSLAGVLAGDRIDTEMKPLLQHPQFYSRLVYASDYPDSAAPGAVDLGALVDQGYIDADRQAALRDIYRVNPLLFVLATMRSLHLPETHLSLPATVFSGG